MMMPRPIQRRERPLVPEEAQDESKIYSTEYRLDHQHSLADARYWKQDLNYLQIQALRRQLDSTHEAAIVDRWRVSVLDTWFLQVGRDRNSAMMVKWKSLGENSCSIVSYPPKVQIEYRSKMLRGSCPVTLLPLGICWAARSSTLHLFDYELALSNLFR